MTIPNLLIIAGTGTNSGKTTLACRLIEQLKHLEPVAVKISPYFHETTPGLELVEEGNDYSIYKEKNQETSKDTSRMLKAGASVVYFAKVTDKTVPGAFIKIRKRIGNSSPIICESPALRRFVDPGLFIIISSDKVEKQKDISHLQSLPHVKLKYDDIIRQTVLPVNFIDGNWIYTE